MYSNFDIYKVFRKCQGSARNSGYRLPKNWELHYDTKMTKENKLALDTITSYFNTKWSIINPEVYFSIGFELFKMGFTYRKFLNKKVMLHYVQRDKMEKRELGLTRDDITKSVDFINKYINDNEVGSKLLRYCSLKDGAMGMPVVHYLNNKITKAFMIFLIWYGFYTPTEDELNKIPYITAHYREVALSFDKNTIKLCNEIM